MTESNTQANVLNTHGQRIGLMSYYGIGDGWCFRCGGIAAHVKLIFAKAVMPCPVPAVAIGRSTRGVELQSVDNVDEFRIAAQMEQITAMRGIGRNKD